MKKQIPLLQVALDYISLPQALVMAYQVGPEVDIIEIGTPLIKAVGMDMVKLEKYQAFASDLSSSIILFICSTIGLPVSTTNTKTTAIMGVGASKRLSNVNWGVAKEMVIAWVLTFPCCGLIAFLMTKFFLMVF